MWSPIRLLNGKSSAARENDSCTVEVRAGQGEIRGLAWVIGAFLICPCHLPLTLALLATLLSGTAAAALLHNHPYLAGAVITLVWMAATWRGIRHIREAGQGR
jgi:cytochrome c biogenesis protein CcdA